MGSGSWNFTERFEKCSVRARHQDGVCLRQRLYSNLHSYSLWKKVGWVMNAWALLIPGVYERLTIHVLRKTWWPLFSLPFIRIDTSWWLTHNNHGIRVFIQSKHFYLLDFYRIIKKLIYIYIYIYWLIDRYAAC